MTLNDTLLYSQASASLSTCQRSFLLQKMPINTKTTLDNVQTLGEIGALSPERDDFIKCLPWGLRDLCGREGRKILEPEGMEDSMKECLPDTYALEDTVTGQDCTGSNRTKPQH